MKEKIDLTPEQKDAMIAGVMGWHIEDREVLNVQYNIAHVIVPCYVDDNGEIKWTKDSWKPSDDKNYVSYYQCHLIETRLAEMGHAVYGKYTEYVSEIVSRDHWEVGEAHQAGWGIEGMFDAVFFLLHASPSQKVDAVVSMIDEGVIK